MARQKNIEYYRTKLTELRDRLTGEIGRMEDAVVEDTQKADNLSNYPMHLADVDSEGVDRELNLIANETGILKQVEEALERIEDGTYGQCLECEGKIAEARLDALPYTPYCIGCAEKMQRSNAR